MHRPTDRIAHTTIFVMTIVDLQDQDGGHLINTRVDKHLNLFHGLSLSLSLSLSVRVRARYVCVSTQCLCVVCMYPRAVCVVCVCVSARSLCVVCMCSRTVSVLCVCVRTVCVCVCVCYVTSINLYFTRLFKRLHYQNVYPRSDRK